MARPQHGDGSVFAQPHVVGYPAGYGYAARPGFAFASKGIYDMDSLKLAISQAVPGTGQVKQAITDATFQPRAPAFTSLIQTCAKFREAGKALEIFDAMQTSEAIDVKPNKVHYRSVLALFVRRTAVSCALAVVSAVLHQVRRAPRLNHMLTAVH